MKKDIKKEKEYTNWQWAVYKLKWLVCELVKTGSNQKSFFSSKRIERLIMFNVAIAIIVGYTNRSWGKLTTEEVLMISGMLIAGGAWNATQIRKDIKEIDQPNENKS